MTKHTDVRFYVFQVKINWACGLSPIVIGDFIPTKYSGSKFLSKNSNPSQNNNNDNLWICNNWAPLFVSWGGEVVVVEMNESIFFFEKSHNENKNSDDYLTWMANSALSTGSLIAPPTSSLIGSPESR